MNHNHKNHDLAQKNLGIAVVINVLLTFIEIAGGILSGSLSLIADALHNFSDAGSLAIAWIARHISKKKPDDSKTFGYRRSELIGALINLVTLFLVGIYLLYQAAFRFYYQPPIEGWTVIIVSFFALVIDLYTVYLTYKYSKNNLNIKAAFLHNISDALSSIGVIIAGTLIILYQWYFVDTIVTLIIASYVIYQAIKTFPKVVHILMEGTPPEIQIKELESSVKEIKGIVGIHHIHVWQIDEITLSLEAHIVITNLNKMPIIKSEIKKLLERRFQITHSTLEFELENEVCTKESHA